MVQLLNNLWKCLIMMLMLLYNVISKLGVTLVVLIKAILKKNKNKICIILLHLNSKCLMLIKEIITIICNKKCLICIHKFNRQLTNKFKVLIKNNYKDINNTQNKKRYLIKIKALLKNQFQELQMLVKVYGIPSCLFLLEVKPQEEKNLSHI